MLDELQTIFNSSLNQFLTFSPNHPLPLCLFFLFLFLHPSLLPPSFLPSLSSSSLLPRPPSHPSPQWRDRNSQRLRSLMSEEDQETYNFDVTRMKWQQYWEQFIEGVRMFLLKEDDSKQKLARQKYRR